MQCKALQDRAYSPHLPPLYRTFGAWSFVNSTHNFGDNMLHPSPCCIMFGKTSEIGLVIVTYAPSLLCLCNEYCGTIVSLVNLTIYLLMLMHITFANVVQHAILTITSKVPDSSFLRL
jgi:hypothetical protein